MKNYVCGMTAVMAAFTLGGCATVINGTSQDVAFKSDPSGAEITLSNGSKCTAPCEMSLKRRHDVRAEYRLEGYRPEYLYLQSRTGGAMAGNLLLGGIIGGAVDASNGSTNILYPNPAYVRLVPLGSDEDAMILEKDGSTVLSSVAAHNDKVREDVEMALGSPPAFGDAGAAHEEAKGDVTALTPAAPDNAEQQP